MPASFETGIEGLTATAPKEAGGSRGSCETMCEQDAENVDYIEWRVCDECTSFASLARLLCVPCRCECHTRAKVVGLSTDGLRACLHAIEGFGELQKKTFDADHVLHRKLKSPPVDWSYACLPWTCACFVARTLGACVRVRRLLVKRVFHDLVVGMFTFFCFVVRTS